MASSSARKKKITWTDRNNTKSFLEIFIAEQDDEGWKETYLSKEGKERLVSKFKDATGYELIWKNFKNHYDNLKLWYSAYQRLIKKTGVHVDPATGEIDMEKEWWNERIEEIGPAVSHIQKKPLQDIDLLERIFRDVLIGTDDGWVIGNGPDKYASVQDSETDVGEDHESNFHEPLSTEDPTQTDKMHPNVNVRRKRKGSGSSGSSEISMAYDRRSETIKFAGEAMGSDRERAVRRVHQLSDIEYNSPFYWDVIGLIETSETARQMVLGLSNDEHLLNYLQRSVQMRQPPPQSDYTPFGYE